MHWANLDSTEPFGGARQGTVPRKPRLFREKPYKTADRGNGHDARPSAAAMAPMHDRLPRQCPPAPTVTVPFVPFAYLNRPRFRADWALPESAVRIMRALRVPYFFSGRRYAT